MMVKALVNRSLRVSVLASAILVSFTLVTTQAEERRPVEVEDILSMMKSVSDPQMSPDGSRIAYGQSIEYYTALKDLGVPAELVIFPRQPHGVRELKLVLDLLQRNVDWFNKWVLEGGQQSPNP